jgi:hypothetical protein
MTESLIPTPGWLPQFLDSGALYHCPQSSSERREGGAWKAKVNTVTGFVDQERQLRSDAL